MALPLHESNPELVAEWSPRMRSRSRHTQGVRTGKCGGSVPKDTNGWPPSRIGLTGGQQRARPVALLERAWWCLGLTI